MVERSKILEDLQAKKLAARSCWKRAVLADSIQLIEEADPGTVELCETVHDLQLVLLSGADSWRSYSWAGCALCYDSDIAQHYCTPSELKRTRGGELRPNSREEWLDVQARGLYQSAAQACAAFKEVRIHG